MGNRMNIMWIEAPALLAIGSTINSPSPGSNSDRNIKPRVRQRKELHQRTPLNSSSPVFVLTKLPIFAIADLDYSGYGLDGLDSEAGASVCCASTFFTLSTSSFGLNGLVM